MIKEIDDKKSIESLFKKYFPSYQNSNIFEKIAVYKEKEIMAMISYSIIYERAEINYIVTFPDFRHHGLAEKLLNFVIQTAIDLQCQSISLEVDKKNTAAINLYLKCGFQKKAVRKNYYQNSDAYLMIKDLVVI